MSSINYENFVVTGSSGYLGKEVVRELKSKGFNVIEIDISNSENPVDLNSPDFAKQIKLPDQYSLLHLAFPLPGKIPARRFVELIHNINLNLVSSLSPLRTLLVSSTAVYSLDCQVNSSPNPWEVYGALKYESEKYFSLHFPKVTIFRPGTLVEASRKSQMVQFMKQLSMSPIPIFPGHGNLTHPFTHTKDLISAICRWAEDFDAPIGDFNLVANSPLTLNEISMSQRAKPTVFSIRIPRLILRSIGSDHFPVFGISKWHFSALTYNYIKRDSNFYNTTFRDYKDLFIS